MSVCLNADMHVQWPQLRHELAREAPTAHFAHIALSSNACALGHIYTSPGPLHPHGHTIQAPASRDMHPQTWSEMIEHGILLPQKTN